MSKFFSYYWTEIKNDELTIIRAYGLNAKNKNKGLQNVGHSLPYPIDIKTL